jgi:heme/copper-type cytochrome/quinol oxidase subunit 2
MSYQGKVRRARRRLLQRLAWLAGVAVAWPDPATGAGAQPFEDRRRFSVRGRKYRFEPARLEVNENDLVRIDFEAEDIPHSFTLDAYRIVKRARPGAGVSFEFRADQAGSFPFYCSLTIDDGCRDMRGELVVRPRRF